jgi:hypothetical protein
MVADSRWTYEVGRDFDDGAVKLVALSTHAMAVYAGDTVVGPRALGRLTEEIKRTPNATPTKVRQLARQCLYSAWRNFSTADSSLQICIGLYDPSSGFHLWSLEDATGFRAAPIPGIRTIGSPDGRVFFWEKLREQVQSLVSTPLTEEAFRTDIERWSTVIAMAVRETCESDVEATVTIGGPMLVSQLTQAGVRGRSLELVDLRGDAYSPRQLTLTPHQAAAFGDRQKRQRPRRASSHRVVPEATS